MSSFWPVAADTSPCSGNTHDVKKSLMGTGVLSSILTVGLNVT